MLNPNKRLADLDKWLKSEVFKEFIKGEHPESDPLEVLRMMKVYTSNDYENIETYYGRGIHDAVERVADLLRSDEYTEEDLDKIKSIIKNAILKLQGKEPEYTETIAAQKSAVMQQDFINGYQSDAGSITDSETLDSLGSKVKSLDSKVGDLQVRLENVGSMSTDNGALKERIEKLEEDFKNLGDSMSGIEEASSGYKLFVAAATVAMTAILIAVFYKNGKNKEKIEELNNKIDSIFRDNPELKISDDLMRNGNDYHSALAEQFTQKAKELGENVRGRFATLKTNLSGKYDTEKLLGEESGSKLSDGKAMRGYSNAIRDASLRNVHTIARVETAQNNVKLMSYKDLGFDTYQESGNEVKAVGKSTFSTNGEDLDDYVTIDGKQYELASDEHKSGEESGSKLSDGKAMRGYSNAIRDASLRNVHTIARVETAQNNVKLMSYKDLGFDTYQESGNEVKAVGKSTFFTNGDDLDFVTIGGDQYELERKSAEGSLSTLEKKLSNLLDGRAFKSTREEGTALIDDDDIDEGIEADLESDLEDLSETAENLKAVTENLASRNNPWPNRDNPVTQGFDDNFIGTNTSAGFEDNFADHFSIVARPRSHVTNKGAEDLVENLRRSNPKNPFLDDLSAEHQGNKQGRGSMSSATRSLIDSEVGNEPTSPLKPKSTLFVEARGDLDKKIELTTERRFEAEQTNRSSMGRIAERIEHNEKPMVKEIVSAFEGGGATIIDIEDELDLAEREELPSKATKLNDVRVEEVSRGLAVCV